MKLKELKELFNLKVQEIKDNKNINEEEATKMLLEIKELKNKIKVKEEIETLELEEFKNLEQKKIGGNDMKKYSNENLVRLINGKATDEDLEIYNSYVGQKESVDADGGYLVPEEQVSKFYEYKRSLPSLEKYINVMEVSSPKGKMPIEVSSSDKLVNFTEGEEIQKSKITFGQISYTVKNYGDIMAVTNQLKEDTAVPLINYILKRIGKKSIRTTNAEVISKLKEISSSKDINKSKFTETILDEYYKLDPSFRVNSILLTNSTGLALLDKLTDKNGTPILTRTYSDKEVIKFRGLEVVEVTDEELPLEETKVPMFIGSLYDYITKFDLKTLEIGISTEAMFTSNATALRAIERFDIVKVDTDAMKYVKVDPAK